MSKNDPRLQAGVAVVTGASAGLGRALAQHLASLDITVAALGRSKAALETTVRDHHSLHPYVCDIADPQALSTTFEQIRADHGPVTLLINNAAVYPRRNVFEESHESSREDGCVRLELDVNRKEVCVCFGYLMDRQMKEAEAFSALADAHPHLLEGNYVRSIDVMLRGVKKYVKRLCRRAKREAKKSG